MTGALSRLFDIRIAGLLASVAVGAALVATPAPQAETAPTKSVAKAAPGSEAFLSEAAEKYFPAEDAAPSPKRVFRLTRDQIDATVRALLPGYVTASIKETMPRDPLQTNYEYAEILNFNASNLGPLTGWIGGIAARVRASPKGVIDCAASGNAPDCLSVSARRFVVQAFRADAPDEKIESIVAFFVKGVSANGPAQATGDLVEVTLNSPYFLFRRELETSRRGRLGAVQHLQAITFTLADTPPEALGLSSGDALQYLQTASDARASVDNVLASKPAREKLLRFFRSWLEVREPGDFLISRETFKEFTPEFAAAMVAGTDALLREALATPAPSLKDITTLTRRDTGTDPSRRFGIFTDPAVLASHSGPTNTRFVKRGVFWVRKVMCMEMATPSKEVLQAIEQSYAPLVTTERARIEGMTKPPECAGCHKLIDPFGAILESYDALGRWRTSDNGHPIDQTVAIDFLDEGPVTVRSPVEALKALTGSVMFKQCFVRQAFRYYMGRNEEPSDEPLLRAMFLAFAKDDKQDILGLIRSLALSETVSRRQM
ncbi:MAG TPA: DUF1588 domain-containing protein [Hyphomicrobiaceae bacterium]|nr:DUF1588 domain-containing protein [Hyphomicrobiaceae bacterium]